MGSKAVRWVVNKGASIVGLLVVRLYLLRWVISTEVFSCYRILKWACLFKLHLVDKVF